MKILNPILTLLIRILGVQRVPRETQKALLYFTVAWFLAGWSFVTALFVLVVLMRLLGAGG